LESPMRVLMIQLQPDLSHCIEAVARNEYERGLRSLLAGKGDEHLAERTDLLRLFLETADFSDLRRQSERYLLEGKKVAFLVYMDGGVLRYELRVS
jgi:hypothetical protein